MKLCTAWTICRNYLKYPLLAEKKIVTGVYARRRPHCPALLNGAMGDEDRRDREHGVDVNALHSMLTFAIVTNANVSAMMAQGFARLVAVGSPQPVVVTRPKVSSKRLTGPAFTGTSAQMVGGKKPDGP